MLVLRSNGVNSERRGRKRSNGGGDGDGGGGGCRGGGRVADPSRKVLHSAQQEEKPRPSSVGRKGFVQPPPKAQALSHPPLTHLSPLWTNVLPAPSLGSP
ncbi:hypothetical protein M0804_009657 [Polistes exclamans]|nr:hypothetical protein M0804_009657 [Polistes exclamans]